MDDVIKEMLIKILDSLKTSLEKGNLYHSSKFGTMLTEISVTRDSKAGVLVGETVESSFLQLYDEMTQFDIGRGELSKEIQDLIPLIDSLTDAIRAGGDDRIYSALLELRFHATKKQYSMPKEYKHHRSIRGLR